MARRAPRTVDPRTEQENWRIGATAGTIFIWRTAEVVPDDSFPHFGSILPIGFPPFGRDKEKKRPNPGTITLFLSRLQFSYESRFGGYRRNCRL
jgi:hypothetical protein